MGTPFSRLVIDIMSNPRSYCSRASPVDQEFRSPVDQEFLYPSRATVMFDASQLAASQYLLDVRFVPWGIATPEGFYGGGPCSFGACLPTRGSCFSLSGDAQEYASAVCDVDSRKGCGPF